MTGRPRLGAHQPIAGGRPRALERDRTAGGDVVQIFTRSARRWAARPIAEELVEDRRNLGVLRALAR